MQVDRNSFLDILDEVEDASSLSQLVNVSYLLIAVGAVLLVIGFLGCCGAIRESKCMLLTVSKVWNKKNNKTFFKKKERKNGRHGLLYL